ncbi:MAG TPA: hypothetical protein DEA08_30350 [Planctomycetes bacterium]|nr:hypothetical protein [Planctomycetota bacterium]
MAFKLLELIQHVAAAADAAAFAAEHPPVLVDAPALERLIAPSSITETEAGMVSPASVLVFPLDPALGDELLIGSSAPAQIVLDRPRVSVRHATLARRPGGTWVLTDLGSTQGTHLDGRKLPPNFPAPLTPGAKIELAKIQLQLLDPAEVFRRLEPLARSRRQRPPLAEGANLVARCDPLAAVLLPPNVPVTIGRSRSQAELVLPHPNVSRAHARLTRVGDQVRVEDLGSSNGTYVGSTRVPQSGYLIHPGEEPLHLGPFEVRVLVMEGESEDLSAAFETRRFDQTRRDQGGGVLKGQLDVLPLRQLVQAVELNQRSGTIQLEEGTLVFVLGRPAWARFRGEQGEGALLKMLDVGEGSFRFTPREDEEETPDAPDADAVIEASFTKVLLEWTRSRDEGGSARTRPTSRRQ